LTCRFEEHEDLKAFCQRNAERIFARSTETTIDDIKLDRPPADKFRGDL
jgi:hypothetical protein